LIAVAWVRVHVCVCVHAWGVIHFPPLTLSVPLFNWQSSSSNKNKNITVIVRFTIICFCPVFVHFKKALGNTYSYRKINAGVQQTILISLIISRGSGVLFTYICLYRRGVGFVCACVRLGLPVTFH